MRRSKAGRVDRRDRCIGRVPTMGAPQASRFVPSYEPYDRARPQGQTYQTMNGNYQKIIKQLDAMLPKPEDAPPPDDGFGKFVEGRVEV